MVRLAATKLRQPGAVHYLGLKSIHFSSNLTASFLFCSESGASAISDIDYQHLLNLSHEPCSMGRLNITACAASFSNNETAISLYGWNGPVIGIKPNKSTVISWQGCEEVCGTSPMYDSWDDIAATITTWIIPVVGVLLQVAFASNAFWSTVSAL